VVTSNALLEHLAKLIKNSDSYWQKNCLWIVASQRIANNAKQLDLSHVINANGASDEAIITAITLTEYGNIS
jgi:uroporphyrinogen-III synthase